MLVLQSLTAMRSEQFGAVHFLIQPTVSLSILSAFAEIRKSMKGGLCGKNVLPYSVRVYGFSFLS